MELYGHPAKGRNSGTQHHLLDPTWQEQAELVQYSTIYYYPFETTQRDTTVNGTEHHWEIMVVHDGSTPSFYFPTETIH